MEVHDGRVIPQVDDLWIKGRSRRVREVYRDDDGEDHVRYRDSSGAVHWVTMKEWCRWAKNAMLVRTWG